jgi:hypothetical protein
MQPSSSCFIVASDYYLLLLHGKRQIFEARVSRLKHRGVEAIIVL